MATPRSLFVLLCGIVTLMIFLTLNRLNTDPELDANKVEPLIASSVIPQGGINKIDDDSLTNDDFGIISGRPIEESQDTISSLKNAEIEKRNKRNEELALIEQNNIALYKNGLLGIYPATGSEKGGTELTFIFAIQNESIANVWPQHGYFGGCIIDGLWAPMSDSKYFSPSQVFLLSCKIPPHAPGEVEVAFLIGNVTRYADNGTVRFTYTSDSAAKPPVVELAVCTVFQDQGLYLREWIAFHTIFGVTKFYLYNQGTDESWRESVKDFIEKGIVVPIRWRFDWIESIRHQATGFWHNVKTYAEEAKWIAYIDVDEFLFIPKIPGQPVPSITKFLQDFTEFGGVMVDRINFGPNGHLKRPPGLVIENYTKRTPILHSEQPGKSIVQPKHVIWAGCGGVHTFALKDGSLNVDANKNTRGDWCGIPYDNVVWDPIRINHYWTKSAEDWADRQNRSNNPYRIPPEELLTKWNYFTEEDTDIFAYVEETKRRMLWGV